MRLRCWEEVAVDGSYSDSVLKVTMLMVDGSYSDRVLKVTMLKSIFKGDCCKQLLPR